MTTPYFRQNSPKDNIFTEILKKGIDSGMLPARTQEARDWYRNQAKRVIGVDGSKLMSSDPTRFRQMVVPGRMYMYFYDPKFKKTLPYYDTFPMVIIIDIGSNYFLGLNLHYLPLNYRAKLMDALYNIRNNNRWDETTKYQITYKLLKSVSELRYYKPCIKKYLKIHVRSRFVSISAEEFEIAAFLPLQKFEKQPTTRVWSDSVNTIQNTKPTGTKIRKPRKPS